MLNLLKIKDFRLFSANKQAGWRLLPCFSERFGDADGRLAKNCGKGKRGGVRIIYFLITKDAQIILFDVYAKSEKENLTKAERNQLKKLTAAYKRSERSKR